MDFEKLVLEDDCLNKAAKLQEIVWINNELMEFNSVKDNFNVNEKDILDAEKRLEKYAPLIEKLFDETKKTNGIIESPIKLIEHMKEVINNTYDSDIKGSLMIKLDSNLPIAGSIKARGGIYEVLRYTEQLALNNGLISELDNFAKLSEKECRDFFGSYTIQVGSTGNLGLSIGIMSAKLGYKTIVHMSVDAKAWKKTLLRSYGVEVIEYDTDYSKAVEHGRNESMKDPKSYFVDDENSMNLFLGYSVAALRLKEQLKEMNKTVDKAHPMFVYLPCGIGGAPGGITFGLKHVFGDNVHCFFVEPTHAPCMLIGMASKLHDKICVNDIGIDGKTDADGLAVGRASKLVGKYMENILSGIFTIDDYRLYDILRMLNSSENIKIEPSACAAFAGVINQGCPEMSLYIEKNNLKKYMDSAIHIVWATGGSLVPEEIMAEYLDFNR